MRALGTADLNSNTINIILNNNDLPAMQWPKWQASKQIKASKYHMRALGTADPNSNTINIILNNDLPAMQWPKWQANNNSKHQNIICGLWEHQTPIQTHSI